MLRRAAFAASGAGALLAAVAGSGVATEHQTPARTFTVLSHAYDDARPPPGYDVRWLTDHYYEAETTTTEAPPPTTEPPTTEPPTTVPVTVVRTTSPPTTPTTAPAAPRATTAPTTAPRASTGVSGGVWDSLAECESGDTNADTGNGYYGFIQFSLATWHGMGESGYPTDYGRGYQLGVGQRLQARSGWGQWPACARMLGLI